MSNPFEYYNKEPCHNNIIYNKKVPQIIMKYRLIVSKYCHSCLKTNYTFNISTIFNSRTLQIPEIYIDKECNIKDEYKFIINEEITSDNLSDWFNIWTNYYDCNCHEGANIQETYIPISFKLI